MLYQWGRKDPFTFATKSNGTNGLGLNPLKIYNTQGKEIVQTLNTDTDTNGGITIIKESASSMLETIKKPNTYYATSGPVVSGTDRNIMDYYWTSYSRGTDGAWVAPNNNNPYLNGYNQQRPKSVYDPCPYGFRIPVNGSFNMFILTGTPWKTANFTIGAKYFLDQKSTWLLVSGVRSISTGLIYSIGAWTAYRFANVAADNYSHIFETYSHATSLTSRSSMVTGLNIRCIEDCKKIADAKKHPLFSI